MLRVASTSAGETELNPILFAATVPLAFPFIMFAALATGALLLRRSQQDLKLTREQRTAVGIAAFCGAMLGAKAPFLLADWEGFLSGSAWFSDGKTILCGMVSAYFSVEFAKWALEIRVKTGDSFAVPVAASVSIGRLACLAAGCCYGTPSTVPWAMQCATTDDLLRHPTQIYESLFHASMALICWRLRSQGIWKGQLVKLYIITYLGYRFATEFIRPEQHYLGGLTAYQWFALAILPVFVWLWWKDASARQTG